VSHSERAGRRVVISLSDCRLITLPKIEDDRGNLTFIESGRHVEFEIKRVYYLYDVPAGAARGGHTHRKLRQLIIAASGNFDVVLDDGTDRRTVHLDSADSGLYLAPMVWREIENFSAHSVCLVLASAHFDESEYIRDYSDYRAAVLGASGS
jgi:dTDP-4-dehydrorhamnose 3,5-epimerase-like enzyme